MTTTTKKKHGPVPPASRVKEMAARGYALIPEITDRFEVSKMSLYLWEKKGDLVDPSKKKRPVSIKVAGNRWFLIDAVRALLGVPGAK